MASASWALQKALHAHLVADPGVLAAIGGARIFGDVPRGAAYPYVTFGITSDRDWSTATEGGSEHILTLHVWSRAAGRRESDAILDAVGAALHDAAPTLAGHRLVNLRREHSEVRRDPDGETYHGLVRFRAVTEPAS